MEGALGSTWSWGNTLHTGGQTGHYGTPGCRGHTGWCWGMRVGVGDDGQGLTAGHGQFLCFATHQPCPVRRATLPGKMAPRQLCSGSRTATPRLAGNGPCSSVSLPGPGSVWTPPKESPESTHVPSLVAERSCRTLMLPENRLHSEAPSPGGPVTPSSMSPPPQLRPCTEGHRARAPGAHCHHEDWTQVAAHYLLSPPHLATNRDGAFLEGEKDLEEKGPEGGRRGMQGAAPSGRGSPQTAAFRTSWGWGRPGEGAWLAVWDPAPQSRAQIPPTPVLSLSGEVTSI